MSKLNSNLGKNKITQILKNKIPRVHFLGVGGVGMFSLFALSEKLGFEISGSDCKISRYTDILKNAGKEIYISHSAGNVKNADLLVYTLAVDDENPEIVFAQKNGIPMVSRAEYLGALMPLYKNRIGVSGSHGKSTVTAMLARVFSEAECDPTVLCGAEISDGKMPYILGKSDFLIYEACEYKDSFLAFSPTAAVFTNLELDHVDYFKDIAAIKTSFLKAADLSPLSVINADSENLSSLINETKSTVITYGECENADFRIREIASNGGCYSFKISHGGELSNEIKLSIPGKFNVFNAAGAYALARSLGLPEECVISALQGFLGIGRRLEYLGSLGKSKIYYDYAHHPTEIREGIKAVREFSGGSVAVFFKPHTYSRTAGLFAEFASALALADSVFVLPIDGIREAKMEGVSSAILAESIGITAKAVNDADILFEVLKNSPDSVIIMGAADIDLSAIKKELKR